jgi:hypothetical protein
MRTLLALILVTLLSVSPALAQSAGADEMKKLVQDLIAVYKTDLPKYFEYFAPDTRMWWPMGRVDKPRYQEMFAKRPPLVRAEVSEIEVLMAPSGDAAVTTYILTIQQDAQAPVMILQMTLNWFRREGKWQIVHLHYQPQREKKAPSQ